MSARRYDIVVIGGGHAGAEAAWAAANLIGAPSSVALVTGDPAHIGTMSCNPAIGGLAKGQLVREIDAMGGVMGLAADVSGIHFKVLNTSKGAAVHGPRCQSDKLAYADAVRALIEARPEIDVIAGTVERIETEAGAPGAPLRACGVHVEGTGVIGAGAVVLTTGTFMRGLMHRGQARTPGGRHGEAPASGMSGCLQGLGFELGRLKTGTPPRLDRRTIDWDSLEAQHPDADPVPFSDLSRAGWSCAGVDAPRFPALEQVECRRTFTTPEVHELIRANLDRAPMFTGDITSPGPRYCPSIEDKVVRFAERTEHGVFLEPESLRTEWVYCNGIATSLPEDVQLGVVRGMPGCAQAEILQHGYAVEYDVVLPHQIHATGMTKRVEGLFLAGQINGTSGYEEAAAQGLVAGINAARFVAGLGEFVLGRDEAYIGVLMDDLVTKTPVEPYRMFTSRAEHRLLLRADNAPDRLTPRADELGALSTTDLGRARRAWFASRTQEKRSIEEAFERAARADRDLPRRVLRPGFGWRDLRGALDGVRASEDSWRTAIADLRYEPYVARQRAEVRRMRELERKRLPAALDYGAFTSLRAETRAALQKFRPATFGQAARLEGMTPADLTLLSVLVRRSAAVGA